MIPTHIIAVDDFPLNKNKKIDTKALIKQMHESMHSTGFQKQSQKTKESHAEKVIKSVWSEVLSIPVYELKRSDNFFSVGGTSLTAVILSRKLSFELCTSVSVQDVFRYQSIEEFVDHIETSSENVIHGMPAPLLYIDGGRTAMNYYVFMLLQILGLIISE